MPEPTRQQLFDRLVAAWQAGTLDIELDPKKLTHPHCPVAADSYWTAYVYGLVALLALAGFLWGWQVAAAGALAAGLAWHLGARAWLHRRMGRFALRRLTADAELWDRMWRFGGVTLRTGGAEATAPADSWTRLARNLGV